MDGQRPITHDINERNQPTEALFILTNPIKDTCDSISLGMTDYHIKIHQLISTVTSDPQERVLVPAV